MIDRALVSALVARLDRRVAFSVSVADRELYVAIGTENLSGAVSAAPSRRLMTRLLVPLAWRSTQSSTAPIRASRSGCDDDCDAIRSKDDDFPVFAAIDADDFVVQYDWSRESHRHPSRSTERHSRYCQPEGCWFESRLRSPFLTNVPMFPRIKHSPRCLAFVCPLTPANETTLSATSTDLGQNPLAVCGETARSRVFRGQPNSFRSKSNCTRWQSRASTPSTPSMLGGYPSGTRSSAQAGNLSQTRAPRRTCRRSSRCRRGSAGRILHGLVASPGRTREGGGHPRLEQHQVAAARVDQQANLLSCDGHLHGQKRPHQLERGD